MEKQLFNANGHAYVDLGLPSGTLWAAMNVGANNEADAGLYFAWGETGGYRKNDVFNKKKTFTWKDYFFGSVDEFESEKISLIKYNSKDKKIVLGIEDDAAQYNMGGDWRMPTEVDFKELLDNTFQTLIKNYKGTGISGHLLVSKINGRTLFFPNSYSFYNGITAGGMFDYGGYWSSSLTVFDTNCGMYLYLDSGSVVMSVSSRNCGRSVRGVIRKEDTSFNKRKVELTEKEVKSLKLLVFALTLPIADKVGVSPATAMNLKDDLVNLLMKVANEDELKELGFFK